MPDSGSLAGQGGLAVGADDEPEPFAGDLFLTLATEGRLVLGAGQADEVIAGLQHTLDMITARLRLVRIWQELPRSTVDELPPELSQPVVDAAFADQLSPGTLEQAARELPKYIEAMRAARRC